MNVKVMADQGADTNLVSAVLLRDIQEHDPKLVINELHSLHTYPRVSSEVCVMYEGTVTIDVYLKIKPGTCLILRNILRRVTKKEIDNL